jgi:hypothetical protein
MKVGDLVKVPLKLGQLTVGIIVEIKEDGVFGVVHHVIVKNVNGRLIHAMPQDVEIISERM